MKLTIDVDKDLMRRARRLTGLRTRREVVQRALRTLVQLKEQERIRRYRGKLPSGRRRPGSARGEFEVLSPYAFKSLDEWPIKEILEWLPYLFTDADIRKLRRADPKLSPRQVLKPRQRVIGVQELAGELEGSFRGGPPDASTNKRYLEEALLTDHLKHAARSTIKRTIEDYRKTLRRLASGPRRTRKV